MKYKKILLKLDNVWNVISYAYSRLRKKKDNISLICERQAWRPGNKRNFPDLT